MTPERVSDGDGRGDRDVGVPPKTAFRILVLFGNVPLFGNERANIETLRQLRDRGSEVLFLIRPDYTIDSIQKELRRLDLPFRFCPYYDAIRFGVGIKAWLKNLWAIAAGSLLLMVLSLRWRPTHLHLGSTAWTINFLPALLLTRVPLVFRAGDVPPRHHALWRWMWTYTAKRAAIFVCDSEFVKRNLVELGAPADRCEVIYAPAPDRAAHVDDGHVHYPGRKPEVTVLYVGQISAEKGVDLLVEAAEALVARYDVRFVIAGDFSWRNSFGEGLAERMRRLGLEDRIVFTGFVANIDALYATADLHVAPSVWEEPYGLTVVEAKSRGIPSIVFPSGGLPELVEHGREGWVCDHPTSTSLRQALEHYLSNPGLIVEQGPAAQASLTTRLNVHRFGERWSAVYESVSGLPSSSS